MRITPRVTCSRCSKSRADELASAEHADEADQDERPIAERSDRVWSGSAATIALGTSTIAGILSTVRGEDAA